METTLVATLSGRNCISAPMVSLVGDYGITISIKDYLSISNKYNNTLYICDIPDNLSKIIEQLSVIDAKLVIFDVTAVSIFDRGDDIVNRDACIKFPMIGLVSSVYGDHEAPARLADFRSRFGRLPEVLFIGGSEGSEFEWVHEHHRDFEIYLQDPSVIRSLYNIGVSDIGVMTLI